MPVSECILSPLSEQVSRGVVANALDQAASTDGEKVTDHAVENSPPLPKERNSIEESQSARVERLGRERPPQFKSLLSECGFVFSIAMSQVLTVSLSVIISHSSILTYIGVLCIWVHCHLTDSVDRS